MGSIQQPSRRLGPVRLAPFVVARTVTLGLDIDLVAFARARVIVPERA